MNKKKIIGIIILIIIILGSLVIFSKIKKEGLKGDKKVDNEIKLIVNNHKLKIKLENNSSSLEFRKKLEEKDIIVHAHDFGNFEKVGDLGFNLPTNDQGITTKSGDIILFQGHEITVYYDTNTWMLTKLGEIVDIDQKELKEILGTGDVILTFSKY